MPPETSPTRIALVITELDVGGAERAFVRLATGLNRSEWEPRVYCLSGRGELGTTLEEQGVPVSYLDARGRFDVGIMRRLKNELSAFDPSVVQTFLHHANIAGRMAGRRAGVPVIVCGIRVAEQRSRWRLRLDRWTQRSVDAWVCVSESVKKFSHQTGGLPLEKLHVIPNGVDAELFANAKPFDWTEIGLPADANVILAVGRLDEQKRPELAYESCRQLYDEFPKLHLVFAGIGPQAETIRAAAERHGLTDRVHVLGHRSDVAGLMKGASLLLHLSAWEGAPNVLLEAGAAALPVVASDIPGNREALGGAEWGLLVRDPKPESVAASLRQVLGDPAKFRDAAVAAQLVIGKRYTWNVMVDSYADIYRALLSGKSGRQGREDHF